VNLIEFISYGFPEVYAAFFTWDPLFFKDLRAQLTPIQDLRHRDRPSDVDPSECFCGLLLIPKFTAEETLPQILLKDLIR
jgi:hypothetical protein